MSSRISAKSGGGTPTSSWAPLVAVLPPRTVGVREAEEVRFFGLSVFERHPFTPQT